MPFGSRKSISSCVWSVKSKKDPRFNDSGSGIFGYFLCDHLPDEVEAMIKKKEEKFGVKRPDDLELSAFADDRENDDKWEDDNYNVKHHL